MSALDALDWHAVKDHYLQRIQIHRDLLRLHEDEEVAKFARLVLGITNEAGNYSAAEHGLGPQILAANGPNAARRVFDLAGTFLSLKTARDVPRIIKEARIQYLQIGVGSEASCMVNPKVCWVVNTRTIWAHLVIKHADNFAQIWCSGRPALWAWKASYRSGLPRPTSPDHLGIGSRSRTRTARR